jgi:hypothetical protein
MNDLSMQETPSPDNTDAPQPNAELLIQSGADIHKRIRQGATPLHFAVNAGNTSNADISAKDNSGRTHAQLAESFSDSADKAIQNILRQDGGKTPPPIPQSAQPIVNQPLQIHTPLPAANFESRDPHDPSERRTKLEPETRQSEKWHLERIKLIDYLPFALILGWVIVNANNMWPSPEWSGAYIVLFTVAFWLISSYIISRKHLPKVLFLLILFPPTAIFMYVILMVLKPKLLPVKTICQGPSSKLKGRYARSKKDLVVGSIALTVAIISGVCGLIPITIIAGLIAWMCLMESAQRLMTGRVDAHIGQYIQSYHCPHCNGILISDDLPDEGEFMVCRHCGRTMKT